MSIKRYAALFIIVIFYAACIADDDHSNLEKHIKYVAGLTINTLYNHNFENPFIVNSNLDPYLNPDDPINLQNTLLAQEPVKLAQENQMQMTEIHSAPIIKIISDANDTDQRKRSKWHCVTPVTLSLIKGPIEITYPATNSIVFVSHSDGSVYIESLNLGVSGQPQLVDHMRIRKKNCSQ